MIDVSLATVIENRSPFQEAPRFRKRTRLLLSSVRRESEMPRMKQLRDNLKHGLIKYGLVKLGRWRIFLIDHSQYFGSSTIF